MSRLKVTVGYAPPASFELLEDVAPNTVKALCQSLPIDAVLTHARWAGCACWLRTEQQPVSGLKGVEHPVASIYPGVMVVRPGTTGAAEILIAYGSSESRGPMGRVYASPVAQVVGNTHQLFEALEGTWAGGATRVRVELDERDD
jgi:hypothetical protein